MSSGTFITLEGGEGVGKSTQARLLVEELARRGIDAVATREPGGTAVAERIREILLGNDGDGLNLRAEAMLFAAARSDHVQRLIVPALADGKCVICDRFVDSNRAYQGGGGGLDDAEIFALHRIGSAGLLPDLTLLFEVAPDVALARTQSRDAGIADRIGGRDAAYHARVASAFEQMARAEPNRFVRIDANGSQAETLALVLAAALPAIESRK